MKDRKEKENYMRERVRQRGKRKKDEKGMKEKVNRMVETSKFL